MVYPLAVIHLMSSWNIKLINYSPATMVAVGRLMHTITSIASSHLGYEIYTYRISSINATFLISTSVCYYLNTNNIDIVVIFISSVPWNSTACHFVTPGTTAHHRVMIIVSSIVFQL